MNWSFWEVLCQHTQCDVHGNAFTIDVLLDPGEGNASLFAAFTEAQQECPRRLWAQDCPLSFFTDEAHNIPGTHTHTHTQKLDLSTEAVIDVMNYEYCMSAAGVLTLHSIEPKYIS